MEYENSFMQQINNFYIQNCIVTVSLKLYNKEQRTAMIEILLRIDGFFERGL